MRKRDATQVCYTSDRLILVHPTFPLVATMSASIWLNVVTCVQEFPGETDPYMNDLLGLLCSTYLTEEPECQA
jgi:hypothetical protein